MTWFFTCNLEWITTNCTRSTGSYNFVSLRKILLALIYSKLHSKSCDYLYKVHVLKIIKKFMSYYKCIQTYDPRAQSMEHSIALLNKRTASRFPLRSINEYWITVCTFYGMLGGLGKHCLRSLVFPSGGWKSLQFTSTPNTLTSVCILSILFSVYFLRCLQEEFVQQSRASFYGDHFLYSQDLSVCFGGDIVRGKRTIVTLKG